jgi:hypothetical protein
MIKQRKIEKFCFRGLNGCAAHCDLEILRLADGRTLVIATERKDNPGASVTNVAEHLASYVCDRFGIDPDRLVWIEHYAYPGTVNPKRDREYDRVTFRRRTPELIRWSESILQCHPDGWPGYFEKPDWRPMKEKDWLELGIKV